MDVPQTRYARSGRYGIAYQVHGSGDHDLVFSAGPFSNIGTVWRFPEAHRLFERLGRFARVVRYDRRDTGLSDAAKDDLNFEAHVQDALAVIEATGARDPVLIGSVDGARALALLAAMHPEQVRALVALAPTVRGALSAGDPGLQDKIRRMIAELDWPGPVVAMAAPSWTSDPARVELLGQYFQTCSTPQQVERVLRLSSESDIGQALPLVQCPTLALYPRDMAFVSADAVREFTNLIPGGEFREIRGDSGWIYALDADLLADIIEQFVTGATPRPVTDRVLATVLFTDLVESTLHAASAGDRAWAELLDRHLATTRVAVQAHGGQTIKTTGDGVLALFPGPAQGIRCAEQIVNEARHLGLELRSGLHTGEVERSSDDIAGMAVHLAARIMSHARAGDVLVSRTVKDLVIGSDLIFADRGEHKLKGIADPWALFAVAS